MSGLVERRRLLEIRHVAGARNPHQLRTRNGVVHVHAELRRRQRVFLTNDDERRQLDRREQRRRIRPGHHRRDRASNRLGAIGENNRTHLFNQIRPLPARRLAQKLGQHVVGHRARPLVPHERQHPLTRLNALRRVGLRPGIGEDEPLKIRGGVSQQREGHVAAHRQPADDGLLDMQRVEEVDDVARGVVHGRRGPSSGSLIETAEMRNDEPPTLLGEHELRLPHSRGQWESVNQNERPDSTAT